MALNHALARKDNNDKKLFDVDDDRARVLPGLANPGALSPSNEKVSSVKRQKLTQGTLTMKPGFLTLSRKAPRSQIKKKIASTIATPNASIKNYYMPRPRQPLAALSINQVIPKTEDMPNLDDDLDDDLPSDPVAHWTRLLSKQPVSDTPSKPAASPSIDIVDLCSDDGDTHQDNVKEDPASELANSGADNPAASPSIDIVDLRSDDGDIHQDNDKEDLASNLANSRAGQFIQTSSTLDPRERITSIVETLLDNALGSGSLWTVSNLPWAKTLDSYFVVDYTCNCIRPAFLKLLDQQHITIQALCQVVPPWDRSQTVQPRFVEPRIQGVYMLLGRHSDGSWAIYIGASSQIRNRFRWHEQQLNHHRNGTATRRKEPYETLSQPGWTVTYHILAKTPADDESEYYFFIETVFTLLLDSISHSPVLSDPYIRDKLHLTFDWIHDMAAPLDLALGSADSGANRPVTPSQRSGTVETASLPLVRMVRLNYELPIRQGWRKPAGLRGQTCFYCEGLLSSMGRRSYAYADDGSLLGFQCYRCLNYWKITHKRRTVEHENRIETINHHRNQALTLNEDGTVSKMATCGSCGVVGENKAGSQQNLTAVMFARDLQQFLCHREREHYLVFGILTPVPQSHDLRCENPQCHRHPVPAGAPLRIMLQYSPILGYWHCWRYLGPTIAYKDLRCVPHDKSIDPTSTLTTRVAGKPYAKRFRYPDIMYNINNFPLAQNNRGPPITPSAPAPADAGATVALTTT